MAERNFDELVAVMSRGLPQMLVPVDLYGFDAERKIRDAAPALIEVNGEWVGLLGVKRGKLTLLKADQSRHVVPFQSFWRDLTREATGPHQAAVDELLDAAGIGARRRERALDAIAGERIRGVRLGTLFQIRTPAGASFMRQLREAGVLWRIAGLFGAHAIEYLLWIGTWWLIGRSTLGGGMDGDWTVAWILLLFAILPFRLITTWWQGKVAVGAGGLLRRRLLDGALKLGADEVKHEGVGHFLGRAIEAEWIESLALGGGIGTALATLEILLSALVLSKAAGSVIEVALLMLWLGVIALLTRHYWRRRLRWTEARLTMTHDLIENMSGHRTRAAQQPSAEWHVEEDRALSSYLALSREMDVSAARLTALAPRGWLLVGLAGLAPGFIGGGESPAALAIAVGGILVAWQAFRRLTGGLAQLAGATIAWRQVSQMFHAAARPAQDITETAPSSGAVVEAKALSFRYASHLPAVLTGASLEIESGDWILLEGESGGGKSTLAALVAGLRVADSGSLVRRGLVACAPQFHENHILTGTFAYNLLLGRHWPPGQKDLAEAREVAGELGLSPLIARMPGDMLQMVGETGWQLSQGERSRVFLARALLQAPDLVILDESFAALDPENLRLALECALRRSKTLMVIAHP